MTRGHLRTILAGGLVLAVVAGCAEAAAPAAASLSEDRDSAARISASAIEAAPAGPACTITFSGANVAGAFTRSQAVTETVPAVAGGKYMCVCAKTGGTPCCTPSALYKSTYTVALPSGDGPKTMQAYFADAARKPLAAYCEGGITLDMTPPPNPSFTALEGGEGTVSVKGISFTEEGGQGSKVASLRVVASTKAMPLNCTSGFTTIEKSMTSFTQANLTLLAQAFVRLCAVDNLGWVSPGVTGSVKVTPDTTAPSGGQLAATGNGLTPDYSKNGVLSLAFAPEPTDDTAVTEMCLTEGPVCAPTKGWVKYAASATYAAKAGPRTVKAYFRDKYLNVSTAVAARPVIVDLTAPTDPRAANVTATTSAATVTLAWYAAFDLESGVKDYTIAWSRTKVPACTDAGAVTTTEREAFFDIGGSSGTVNFRLCSRNHAGHLSAGVVKAVPVVVVPDTILTAKPSNGTATSATFSFSSPTGKTFECKLDSAAWAACSSPVTRTGLRLGSHTFQVRAVDGPRNVDPSPAAVVWTVACPGTDQWFNGTLCKTLTACIAGEYESNAPSPLFDRTCRKVRACVANEVQTMAPTAKSDRICECRDGYERSGAACRPVTPTVTSVRALDADGQYTVDLPAPYITNARSVRVSGSASPGATVTLRRSTPALPTGTLSPMAAAATGPTPPAHIGQTVAGANGWSYDLSDELDLDFVLASDAEGVTATDSAPTKLVIDRTPPADVPGTIKFTAGTDGVSVEWSPPPSKEGVVSFEIEVTPTTPTSSEPSTKATCAASPCRVDGLAPGLPMTARIRTKDAAGNVSQGRLEGFSTTRCTSAATCGCKSGFGYDPAGDGTRASCLKCALFGLWGRCFGPLAGASGGTGSGTDGGGQAGSGSGSGSPGAGSDTPTGSDSDEAADTTTLTGTTDPQDDTTAASGTTLPQATGTTLSTDSTTLPPVVDTTTLPGSTSGGSGGGSNGDQSSGPSWLDRVSEFIETVFGRLGWSWFEGYLGTLSTGETTVADATTVRDGWNRQETTTLAGDTTLPADTSSLDSPGGVDTTTLAPGPAAKLAANITSLDVTAGEGRTIRRSFTVRVPAGTPFDSKDVSFAGDGEVGNKLVVTTKVDDGLVVRDGDCDVYQVGVEVRAAIGTAASRGTGADGVSCKPVTGRLQVRAGGESLNVPVTITPVETQTIIIYAMAENDLDIAIHSSIAHLAASRDQFDTERLKIVVIADFPPGEDKNFKGIKGEGLAFINPLEGEKIKRSSWLAPDGVNPYRVDRDEVRSTDTQVCKRALGDAIDENQATHITVLFNDHGGPTGVGIESAGPAATGRRLTQVSVAAALRELSIQKRGGRPFDVVSFQACLANSPSTARAFDGVATQVFGYANTTRITEDWLTMFAKAMAETNGGLRNRNVATSTFGNCSTPAVRASLVRNAMVTLAAAETQRYDSPMRAAVVLDPTKVTPIEQAVASFTAAVRSSPDLDAIGRSWMLLFQFDGKTRGLPGYGLITDESRLEPSKLLLPSDRDREFVLNSQGHLLDLGTLLNVALTKTHDPKVEQAAREVVAAAQAATTAKNLGAERFGQLGLQVRFPRPVLDASAPLPTDDAFMTNTGLLSLVREMSQKAQQTKPAAPATTVKAPAKSTTPKKAGTAETRRVSVNASAGGQALASLSLVDSAGVDRGDVAAFAFQDTLDVSFDLPFVVPSLTDDSGVRADVAVRGLGASPSPGAQGRIWGTVTMPGLATASTAALSVDAFSGAVVGAELLGDGLMASVGLEVLVGGSFSAELENLLDGTSSVGAPVALSAASRVTYSPAPAGPYGLVLKTTDWAGSTTWATTDVVVQ